MARPQSQGLEELSPEQLEICQILHRLWWKARKRRLARLEVAASREKSCDEETSL